MGDRPEQNEHLVTKSETVYTSDNADVFIIFKAILYPSLSILPCCLFSVLIVSMSFFVLLILTCILIRD